MESLCLNKHWVYNVLNNLWIFHSFPNLLLNLPEKISNEELIHFKVLNLINTIDLIELFLQKSLPPIDIRVLNRMFIPFNILFYWSRNSVSNILTHHISNCDLCYGKVIISILRKCITYNFWFKVYKTIFIWFLIKEFEEWFADIAKRFVDYHFLHFSHYHILVKFTKFLA